jgi:hypothetical protein
VDLAEDESVTLDPSLVGADAHDFGLIDTAAECWIRLCTIKNIEAIILDVSFIKTTLAESLEHDILNGFAIVDVNYT